MQLANTAESSELSFGKMILPNAITHLLPENPIGLHFGKQQMLSIVHFYYYNWSAVLSLPTTCSTGKSLLLAGHSGNMSLTVVKMGQCY